MPTSRPTLFFPRLIRHARNRAGLSQRELAERCDVVQPSVVAWESGRRSTGEATLAKVATALGYGGVHEFLTAELAALNTADPAD